VTDRSVRAVIETVNVGLMSYFMAPASEPKLTNPEEVQEASRGIRVGKAPGPNGIPNRASTASGIPPSPNFYSYPHHPSLTYSVEAPSSDLCTQTGVEFTLP
jgi:hypothetical protein